jgi:hypothetical protein
MRGPIRWTLTEGAGGGEVINEQTIVADRRFQRPLGALAQRAFAYNRDWAFKICGRGLQRAVDQVVAARIAGTPVS